jgi:hypothetical protein
MSVSTAADTHIASAKEHIRAALRELNEVVVMQCWGHDDFNDDYQADLKMAHKQLIDLRDLLD